MLNRLNNALQSRCPVLFKDTMPVWLTLLLSCAAALAAYFLSPAVNRQFEIDKARAEHVSKATENLNNEIVILSQKLRRLNDALVNHTTVTASVRSDCLDEVTKLQWMLVDLRVVLNRKSDKQAVDQLAVAIAGVQKALDVAVDERAQPVLLSSMRTLGASTQLVLDRLYDKASLK